MQTSMHTHLLQNSGKKLHQVVFEFQLFVKDPHILENHRNSLQTIQQVHAEVPFSVTPQKSEFSYNKHCCSLKGLRKLRPRFIVSFDKNSIAFGEQCLANADVAADIC